jgi:hypothetical protein
MAIEHAMGAINMRGGMESLRTVQHVPYLPTLQPHTKQNPSHKRKAGGEGEGRKPCFNEPKKIIMFLTSSKQQKKGKTPLCIQKKRKGKCFGFPQS